MIIIKIALCGYSGKTGKKIYELLKENGYEVFGVDIDKPLINIINKIDVVIDFTNVNVSLKHINIAIKHRKDFIVGTTGFAKKQIKIIKERCIKDNIKGIICYNFSLPINYILKSIDFFSNYFDDYKFFDIHHISKLDKKSGTTYLFKLKNKNFEVKSTKTSKNTITYVVQMTTKYDKIIISYQVKDKIVFALGVLEYLKTFKKENIINLLEYDY